MGKLVALALTISVGTTVAASLGALLVPGSAWMAAPPTALLRHETLGSPPTWRADRSVTMVCAVRNACTIRAGNERVSRPVRASGR